MINPIEKAAQIWCLPQFADREMDAAFAEAIANAIQDGILAGLEMAAEIASDCGSTKIEHGVVFRSDAARAAEEIRAKAKEIREGKV